MSDPDNKWSTEATVEPARKKRGLPTWVLGCGIGCGLVFVVGVLLSIIAFRAASRMSDPELQWEALEEVIELAERSPRYEIMGMPPFMKYTVDGFRGGWTLKARDGRTMATIFALDADPENDFWRAMFEGGNEGGQAEAFGNMGCFDPEPGLLSVQGRELRTLRYRTRPEDEDEGDPELEPADVEEARDAAGEGWLDQLKADIKAVFRASVIRVGITPEPVGDHYLVVELRKQDTLERVSDEEISAFLELFDLAAD